ncbi:MAG: hypothetical protein PWQ95_469 [Thermococcaceae archaeon]|nr:hypothetical protein [Thermococcaceae archaeon]
MPYWAKTYGGEVAWGVAVDKNGDIIVVGRTEDENGFVARLDREGNVKWFRTYGGSDYDWAYAVALAPNGDIIVAGATESFGAGWTDVWVLRLDENGKIKWQKTYGGSGLDGAYAVALASNGDIIVAGTTRSFGAGKADAWVLRLEANGNVKWGKTYGGERDDKATAVATAPNGDIIVAGYSRSFRTGLSVGPSDAWFLRLDANGNVKWQKTYGGSGRDEAYAVALADNGDIIVAGYTWSFRTGSDAWFLRLDENGNVKWQKTYRGSSWDYAEAVALAPNGDIIVAGRTDSFEVGNWDAWIIRLPLEGNLPGCSSCKDSNAQVSELHPTIEDSNAETHETNAKVEYSNAYPHSWSPRVVTRYKYEPATLSITSDPSGASVYVDGSYAGETPLSDYQVSPGEHTVEVRKEGYEPYTKKITVSAGEKASVSATLVAIATMESTTTTKTSRTSTTTATTSNIIQSSTSPPSKTPVNSPSTTSSKLPYAIGAIIIFAVFGGVVVKLRSAKGEKLKPPEKKEKIGPKPPKTPETVRKEGTHPAKPVSQPMPVPAPKKEAFPGFPSELLSRYEPLEFLGEGGFAKVFKVRRKKDGQIVALKIPRIDEKTSKTFLREVTT